MAEYLFELLMEEVPAWMLDSALATLRERLGKLTAELGGGTVHATATSRRLVLFLSNLPERAADQELEVKGPPKRAAYDASGKPTAALQGFLKKQNAAAEDLIDSGDEYVRIRRHVAGRAAAELVQIHVADAVDSLRWPKMMRWGTGEKWSYIRPIHSIVSVFDGQHLPLPLFGIESGTKTVGHRTLAPGAIEVTSYSDYVSKLELASVIVEVDRRKRFMVQRALTLGKEVEGAPAEDASIWAQWQYLTEYPGLVRAEFRREYLALPEEVLVTVMRVHQKQLPIRDRDGRLSNSFLAVLDNQGDPDGNAAYGNSFVTNARFADAQFFYETDRKRKLSERVEQLAHLQFHEKLGNYRQKSERIQQIAREIGNDPAALLAAELCKTDLVTEMVKEFTELQGKVGGIYAREEGHDEVVWQAIYDHYLPAAANDPLPRSRAGAIVSLADKIDTLAGFFLIGAIPTGSKDPFGLRRAAQGVVQILLNRDQREVRIGLDALIDAGFRAHGRDDANARRALEEFFEERVKTILETSAWQFAYDEIAAAMAAGWKTSLTDLVDRISAVKSMRDEANFLSILDSAKRIANITAGHDSTDVDASRLEHDTERRLAELTDVVTGQIGDLIAERRYHSAVESFAAMAPELEKFFQDVMVMVDDEAVRRNRMSLLRKVGGAVMKIADVTKIVVDRRDYRA
ncbi:MAG TPA: glycine--tRNA ligase subunit beta [Thermoanaerobaculia bacterium]|jgi:glycyl-tRNA synthetase beta chain